MLLSYSESVIHTNWGLSGGKGSHVKILLHINVIPYEGKVVVVCSGCSLRGK